MAGPLEVAKQICRAFCFQQSLCVNVHATDYIYTCGEESGFVVELINYPRFPTKPEELDATAAKLAEQLREGCCQWSYTVMSPGKTQYVSHREEKAK